jgi:hypothetical protein
MAVIAAIGLGLQALGMGADIIGGISARKAQREAERQAEIALNQAKQKIEVNRQEGVQIPLDSYELAMRENTAQQMQALEGLREADQRTLAAGVGKLGAIGTSATEAERQRMQADIYNRDQMIASEEANIDRALTQISLQEAAGAQQAAADREQMAARQFSSAVKGAGNIATSLYQMQDLYGSRQTELDAAKALQKQGMYEDMNTRQARRAMLRDDNFSKQDISNLASFGNRFGKDGGPFTNALKFSAFQYPTFEELQKQRFQSNYSSQFPIQLPIQD